MIAIEKVASLESRRILESSIRQRVRTTLAVPTKQGWQNHKCELVAGSAIDGFVQLRLRLQTEGDGPPLLKPGAALGVSFRVGQRKCMFSCVASAVETKGAVLFVKANWPQRVEMLQRRAYQRVSPPAGHVVAVRFWREHEDDSAPSATPKRHHGQLEDISAGGMLVNAAESIDTNLEAAYRCVFSPKPGAPAVIVTAMLRHLEPGETGRVSLGFQFVGLEAYPEGREQLTQLASVVGQYKAVKCRRRR